MVQCALLTARALRIMTLIAAPAMIALGVSGFTSLFYTLSFISFILGFYVIIFGVLIILSELGWKRFLKHFAFLETRRGRSVFYMFCGTICTCVQTFPPNYAVMGICVGSVSIAVGFSQFIFSCVETKMTPQMTDAVQKVGVRGPLSQQQPAPIGALPVAGSQV
ncbi:hypothetical protein PAPYR_6386 [Paratrimastix pyriformis]|uniref:Uncharacterized protein n=1 Tax=Paratrimastix pyriformis TaxID=342808 RepID=A0ABQ8UGT3_9EUKA|nr:hypothetical protein PAPYR_6386 [Paratrimastix pyriformis]|eukprot:GAFH01005444.1.p2 GENE.GAFH01005444.1~~GAFH01005444.1.p2  ORF type:complete len:176 (-),score=13.77 GAFH01005444.1:120-611(-)